MHPIGFSTGALARGDFQLALTMMTRVQVDVVELSALRLSELDALVEFGLRASLTRYRHISVHAPARFSSEDEPRVVERLSLLARRGWPVVLHPDAIHNPTHWLALGPLLFIENMDKRKRVGRTAEELAVIFGILPQASLCFDIAHARQVDSSMTEAYRILRFHRDRIRQVHLSEVDSGSKHDRMSSTAIRAYRQLAGMIPENVPVVLESPVSATELELELQRARLALGGEVLVDSVSTSALHSGS